jgi:hypothetical protein
MKTLWVLVLTLAPCMLFAQNDSTCITSRDGMTTRSMTRRLSLARSVTTTTEA